MGGYLRFLGRRGKALEHLNIYGTVQGECEKRMEDTLETQEKRNEEDH